MDNQNGYYNSQNGSQGRPVFNQYGTYTGAGYQYARYQPKPEQKDPFISREARHITKLSVLAGAAILSFLGMQNIMGFLLSKLGLSELYMSNYSFQLIFGTLCTVICIFVPFMAVYGLYSKGDRDRCFDFGKPVSAEAFGLAVCAGVMVCFLGDYIASGFNCFVGAFGVSFVDVDTKAPENIFEFFLFTLECAVVPALVEEFAVRGVIMQPLRRYGDRFAVTTSAVIFAMMHGNMMQIPVALIAGFALGYFAIATKSIWTSVAIHFINNFFAVIITTFGTNLDNGKNSTLISSVTFVMILAVVGAGIYCLIRFIKTEHNGLGLTHGPRIEKILFAGSAVAFIIISYFVAVFETVIPVLYFGSAVVMIVFFFIYRNENLKTLSAVSVTGMPEKLMASLYAASPTVILAYYLLTVMTVDLVALAGAGSFIFCFLLFALFYVISITSVSNVRKSNLIDSKKPYNISAVLVASSVIFTIIFMLVLILR